MFLKIGRVRPGLVMVAVGVALLSAVAPVSSVALADGSTGSAGVFVPSQGRIVDTRNGTGGYSTPLVANSWTPVTVAGLAGVPVTGVSSVQITLTAVAPSAVGLVSVSPDVASPHGGTALFYRSGDTGSFSNTAIVAVGTDGKIVVNSTASIDLLIDVQGYYTAGDTVAAGGFAPVTQTRIANTTNGTNVPQAKVVAGNTLTVQAGGVAGVPADASAVFIDISLINYSTPSGWLAASSDGNSGGTGLNFPAGTAAGITTAIGTTVPLADDGSFQLYVGPSGSNIHVDLAIDIEGYFDGSTNGGAFTPASTRVLDTRTPSAPIAANATVSYQISGINSVPAMSTGINAIFANLQVINGTTTNGGYLRTWPTDQAEPTGTSDLNYLPNSVRSNTVSIQLSADGRISIHNVAPFAINLIIDIQGWYTSTRPAAPEVTSTSLTDGGTVASPSSPTVFTLQSSSSSALDTPAVRYRYWLDDADTATIAGESPSLTIPAVADGLHDLLVVAVDAAGSESDAADFSWVVGEGQLPSSPDANATGPSLATLVTTVTTTTTNDDGSTATTTDSSMASTPAEDSIQPFDGTTASQIDSGGEFDVAQNLPGGGGTSYRKLSCAKERVIWVKTTYAQLAVRYNCHYGRGTINWDQRLSPEPPGRIVSLVYEDGMKWNRTGVLGTRLNQKNGPHVQAIDYIFHGSVDTPARVGDLVTASDFFVYSWQSATQHATVKITLTWGCNLTP